MSTLIDLWEIPTAKEIHLIAGWRQWADAGSISSGLPEYLINQFSADKIGEIAPNGYYLFQIPGTHHLMRPVISLKDGYRQSMETKQNEFYYAGDEERGVLIFLGDEPHLNVDQYCEALLEAIQKLNIKRVLTVAGVYGPMPYDRERQISCIYSLPRMKQELDDFAVRFSDYEGGSTIGSYFIHMAEDANVEAVGFFAFVPSYDFTNGTVSQPQGLQIEYDYKAWYDLMRRANHLFGLKLNLTDLEARSQSLLESVEERMQMLESEHPNLEVQAIMARINAEFDERPFDPLADVWDEGLRDLFDETDD